MLSIQENFPLLSHNTFGLNVRARYWIEFATTRQLSKALDFCSENQLPWTVLSGGSNIILTGRFDGVVLHPAITGIDIIEDSQEHVLVKVGAGEDWDGFVSWAVEHGFGGIENLSMIPGMVGASPVQNIGAYGSEVKDTIVEVEYFDTENRALKTLATKDCRFGYRSSIFKEELKGKAIVTGVTFRLDKNPSFDIRYGDLEAAVQSLGGPSLANIRQAVMDIRRAKLPDPTVNGNAGSFFKNPVIGCDHFGRLQREYPDIAHYPLTDGTVKVPAGWLIDRAGWKGYRGATVGVHPRQALVLINLGGATAQDILDLAGEIIADVEHKFEIKLTMEVNVL